jgi:hypothetical protein
MNNTNKKPIKPNVIKENLHAYHLTDNSRGRVEMKAMSEGDMLWAYPTVATLVEQLNQQLSRNDIEPSAELQAMFATAKDYVEALTGYDLSSVDLVFAPEMKGIAAEYCPYEAVVRIYEDVSTGANQQASEAKKRAVITSLLVHELMHATGANNFGVVTLGNGARVTHIEPRSGLLIHDLRDRLIKPGEYLPRLNSFIEEATAEEAASRWRVANDPGVALHANDLCSLEHGSLSLPTLPFRYISNESGYQPSLREYTVTSSAYCAEGMRMVAEYTETDIFQYMIDSRDPEKSADARRKIVAAIESVEKGLYTKLRDLPYDGQAFIAGFELIQSAIARSKNKTKAIGRVAAAA